jgi:hypothetical protein
MWVSIQTELNSTFPGTLDFPMISAFIINPFTGEKEFINYNLRNLYTDRDYEEAGMTYDPKMKNGWGVIVYPS